MKKLWGVLMISMLSACASQTTQQAVEVEERLIGSGGVEQQASTAEGQGVNSNDATFHPLKDPNNILSKRSIYYDFDSYVVMNEYRALVLAHADYLRKNVNAGVLLQGNTDSRGSREYNLALGQRRADSVKNIMLLSGAKASQVESVSLGEEKPRAMNQDESSWSENRRTDIIYWGE